VDADHDDGGAGSVGVDVLAMPVRARPPSRSAAAVSSLEGGPQVLLEVGDLVRREVDLEKLLAVILEKLTRALGADRGTLYLVDRARGEVFSRAAQLPELGEIRIRLGQGIAGHVAQTGETVNVARTHGDSRFFSGIDQRTGYRTTSALAVPMKGRAGEVIGVVQVLNKKRGSFAPEDEALLLALAAQAAVAVEATSLGPSLRRFDEGSRKALPLAYGFNRIVGNSEAMRAVYRLTEKAAQTLANVLVRGESGTGKELIARAVHVNSARSERPFVKVDCAALPEALIENELFGHEKGAFTGADARAEGKFEAAAGGTVFIDELGELPLAVQGKLLGVLQDRSFTRVGGTRPLTADVRVVAATNRDLERMVADGRFRADLYYRIKVVEIVLPPLRARGPEDIARLVRHFVDTFAKKHGKQIPGISDAAIERLARHPWPGNVRELENCIESAVVLSDGGVLRPEQLALPSLPTARRPARTEGTVVTLAEAERAAIEAALEACAGNRSQAARALAIGRNTLLRKLKTYGLL
jgi:Nif-specific regulatory protein